jgi:hypothetical protein
MDIKKIQILIKNLEEKLAWVTSENKPFDRASDFYKEVNIASSEFDDEIDRMIKRSDIPNRTEQTFLFACSFFFQHCQDISEFSNSKELVMRDIIVGDLIITAKYKEIQELNSTVNP